MPSWELHAEFVPSLVFAMQVVDLNDALGDSGLTMKQLLRRGQKGLADAQAAVDAGKNRVKTADVEILAPLYDPEKIICIGWPANVWSCLCLSVADGLLAGMNYVDHCNEQGFPIPKEPVIFSKFSSAISKPDGNVVLEDTEVRLCARVVDVVLYSTAPQQELDFEVELAIIVGKKGRHVKAKDAMDYVAGFAVAHDVSARDWQLKRNGGQWLLGKTFDSFCPFGPALVTKDEVKDPHNLGIRCYLNDKEVTPTVSRQGTF